MTRVMEKVTGELQVPLIVEELITFSLKSGGLWCEVQGRPYPEVRGVIKKVLSW